MLYSWAFRNKQYGYMLVIQSTTQIEITNQNWHMHWLDSNCSVDSDQPLKLLWILEVLLVLFFTFLLMSISFTIIKFSPCIWVARKKFFIAFRPLRMLMGEDNCHKLESLVESGIDQLALPCRTALAACFKSVLLMFNLSNVGLCL